MVLAMTVTGALGRPALSFSIRRAVGRFGAMSRDVVRTPASGRRYSMLGPVKVLPDDSCVAITFPSANIRSSRV